MFDDRGDPGPVAKRDWAEERRFEEGLQKLKGWIV
jgi:hypothetical protein